MSTQLNRRDFAKAGSLAFAATALPSLGQAAEEKPRLKARLLKHAGALGYEHAHIWVEPPKAGDEYIFFARSDQQRKPMKREKLREWYKKMLDKAKDKGIVGLFSKFAIAQTTAIIAGFISYARCARPGCPRHPVWRSRR